MANTQKLSAPPCGGNREQQNDDGRFSIRYSENLDSVSEYEIEFLMSSVDQLRIMIEAFEVDEATQRGLQS